MKEIEPGLWWWTARHPEWADADVSSYAVDDGTRLLLIDPLAVPAPILEIAGELEPIIVLTNPWHEREAPALAERLGATVYAPPPDDDGKGIRMPAERYEAGDRLPFGVEAFPGREPPFDVLLRIESHAAVAIGDTLIDRGNGLEIPEDWLPDGMTRATVVAGLQPLLALPFELVLPTHGAPTDRAALEQALA